MERERAGAVRWQAGEGWGRRAWQVLASMVLGLGATAGVQAAPPVAPVRPVTDVYHGTAVVDPYRWMEDMAAPEFQGWLRGQADHAQQVLARIPGREALLQRVTALSSEAGESVLGLQAAAGRLFFLKLEPGRDQPRLFVRDAAGVSRLLLDPTQLPDEPGAFSIDFFTPSPDGRWVALGLSRGGSEDSELRVLGVAEGRFGPERLRGAGLNEHIAWLPDSRRFFYNRLPPPDASGRQERYTRSAVWLHTLGQAAVADTPVFGWGVSPQRRFEVPDLPSVHTVPGSPWLLAEVLHGDAAERSYHVVRLADLRGAATPWQRLIGPADGVTQAVLGGAQVFALSQQKASRRELWRFDLRKAGSAPHTMLPAGETVLRQLVWSPQALFIEGLDAGVSRVLQLPPGGTGTARALPLPLAGSLRELVPHRTGAWLRLEGWAQPAAWWELRAGTLRPSPLQAPSALDTGLIEVRRERVHSADGTEVPLTVLMRKGQALDGERPTLLSGYGAYGISMEPRFSAQRLAWIERGGVIAVAHVRGGGEFGADWHRGGWILTKQNTVSDFIACAEHLIAARYTRPGKLAGAGGSAGGITIGGAITQRPELFGVAHSAVGVSDMLRMELTPNGAPNVAEFGSAQNPEQFKAMYALSPYHRIRDGVAYPAVIVTTGANDPRVDAWLPAKLAARLQAASASAKPVLLRVDFAGGHGMGSGRSQRLSETADVWSFMLWQMGEPGFQPRAGD